MDDRDIDKVLQRAKDFELTRGKDYPFLNPISRLPSSKENLKDSIKERIRTLHDAYVSLATFVSDDEIEIRICGTKEEQKKVYEKVLKDMERYMEEIKQFDPFGGNEKGLAIKAITLYPVHYFFQKVQN